MRRILFFIGLFCLACAGVEPADITDASVSCEDQDAGVSKISFQVAAVGTFSTIEAVVKDGSLEVARVDLFEDEAGAWIGSVSSYLLDVADCAEAGALSYSFRATAADGSVVEYTPG